MEPTTIKARGSHAGESLDPFKILLWFTRDTLLTASIYIVLSGITLVLGNFADITEEPWHKKILVFLEFSIFIASSIAVFVVILYVLAVFIVAFFREIKSSFYGAPLGAIGDQVVLEPDKAMPSIEQVVAYFNHNKLIYAISAVLLLGVLGAFGLHQRQIEDLRRDVRRQRSMAIDNFFVICRANNGKFDERTLTCHLQDGRMLPLRLIDTDVDAP